MQFINRKKEIEYLRESLDLSKNKLFSMSISGLRRVGKTRLVLEFLRNKDLYFFVNKNKESGNLLSEYAEILKKRGIIKELESFRNWDDFFKVIFEDVSGVVVFDEFQNFFNIDKSVFGIMQKFIDLNENKKNLFLIFTGSTVGLIKKIFSDSKEPLYGRLKRRLNLKPLPFKDCIKICNNLDINKIEEAVILHSLFGGYPKYYISIEDEGLKGAGLQEIMERFFFKDNAVLEDEILQILSLEFGKRTGIYYNILSAIANGNTRISEIASFLRKKESAITRQIDELVNYFEIVGIEAPLIHGRNLFYIKHQLMNFWFKYFFPHLSSYKRREEWVKKKIVNDINSFIGKGFEMICREVFDNVVPFEYERIGRQCGKFKGEKGKNTYEIDIVALNEKKKEILFGECKWKDKVNALEIVNELKEKSRYVDWYKEERKESFAVFAKSFSKRSKEFEGKKVFCFDLKDMEESLIKKKRKK